MPLRILHLEDNPNDAELVQAMLAEDGLACEIVRVESCPQFADAIERERFDLILSDFTLPSYDGRSALLLAREKCPDTPVLFFSGTIGEEAAIQALKNGATDYVLKQRPARFVPAVRRALLEAEDRAKRRHAEEQLRKSQALKDSVVQSALDCIIVMDHRGLVIEFNPAAESTFGYAREAVLGKPLADLIIPPSLREQHRRGLAHYLATGEGPVLGRRIELTAMKADGAEFPVELSVTPIAVEGQPIFTAFLRDLTERKRLEQQFYQSQKMEAVGQLTGGIAHDFNNLLTVINGYSELTLQFLKAGDPLRPNLEQIKEAGERAAALTRQLLAFSRKQVLEPKVLDLNAVVTNIEKLLTRTIGEDIDLVASLMPGLDRVKADPGQIEQVTMNLVVNARDAMPQGGKLTIETANVELDDAYARSHVSVKPGRYVMLAVSDTGCGMDADTQKRVFEPFFTTKEKGKGTGLGLATVYGIVKQSGGYIWVYSEVGKGTTFKVYLPRVEEEPTTVLPRAVHAAPLKGTETILLVEDDEPLRKLTHSILQHGGYGVLVASSREEALQLCSRHEGPVHLMLTDVVMAGMSGREFVDRLASTRPAMKVLFMSGYTDEAITRHGVLIEGVAFLQKPFTAHGLLRKVREVLDAPVSGRKE